MRGLKRFFRRFLNLATKHRDNGRLKEEIESHLANQAEENIRVGMAPGEARRQALLKFGAVEAICPARSPVGCADCYLHVVGNKPPW